MHYHIIDTGEFWDEQPRLAKYHIMHNTRCIIPVYIDIMQLYYKHQYHEASLYPDFGKNKYDLKNNKTDK